MMEAARTSETLVNFYQTTRSYNPEDSHLNCFYVALTERQTYGTLLSLFPKKGLTASAN
jgi:hypothetical protein